MNCCSPSLTGFNKAMIQYGYRRCHMQIILCLCLKKNEGVEVVMPIVKIDDIVMKGNNEK